MQGISRGSPVSWQISSAVGISTRRWRELFFVFGAPRHLTCSRLASTWSCPCTAPSSWISKRSSRMRFVILGTTWMCTRFHPFLSLVGWWPGWERLPISPRHWSSLSGQRRAISSFCWPNHLLRCLGGPAVMATLLQPLPLLQGLHFPPIPGEVDVLLWLVSWKGRCSGQQHCSPDCGLPYPFMSWQGFVCLSD